MLQSLLLCVFIYTSYHFIDALKSVELDASDESAAGASIDRLKNIQMYSVSNVYYWRINPSDSKGFHMHLTLNNSWSFHPILPTTLKIEIYSNSPIGSGNYRDLLVSFSQSNSKYFSTMIQIDEEDDHYIYPQCQTYPTIQPLQTGDIKDRLDSNDIQLQPQDRIDRAMWKTLFSEYQFIEPYSKPPSVEYPLTFILNNNPSTNSLLFTYTNPGTTARTCSYENMASDVVLDVYIAVAYYNQYIDISSFNITHWIDTPQPTTSNPTTSEPTAIPTTATPTTAKPSLDPTLEPTSNPSTAIPTTATPTMIPTTATPTTNPSTYKPTANPSTSPTIYPTESGKTPTEKSLYIPGDGTSTTTTTGIITTKSMDAEIETTESKQEEGGDNKELSESILFDDLWTNVIVVAVACCICLCCIICIIFFIKKRKQRMQQLMPKTNEVNLGKHMMVTNVSAVSNDDSNTNNNNNININNGKDGDGDIMETDYVTPRPPERKSYITEIELATIHNGMNEEENDALTVPIKQETRIDSDSGTNSDDDDDDDIFITPRPPPLPIPPVKEQKKDVVVTVIAVGDEGDDDDEGDSDSDTETEEEEHNAAPPPIPPVPVDDDDDDNDESEDNSLYRLQHQFLAEQINEQEDEEEEIRILKDEQMARDMTPEHQEMVNDDDITQNDDDMTQNDDDDITQNDDDNITPQKPTDDGYVKDDNEEEMSDDDDDNSIITTGLGMTTTGGNDNNNNNNNDEDDDDDENTPPPPPAPPAPPAPPGPPQ